MKSLHSIPALRRMASAIIWFEPPGTALRDPVRFLAYAMTKYDVFHFWARPHEDAKPNTIIPQ